MFRHLTVSTPESKHGELFKSNPSDYPESVKGIDAKMLFPVHTVHPEAYRKVAKEMTLVEEGIKYDIK